ncbi:MAG TPA: 50S ribosomal protein L9 [Rhodanobacteraceae bacterium]
MQLILLEKVKNLGALGDKVNVRPGYGRNYLLPQGKAVPATAANLAEFEARRAEYEAKANDILAAAEARKAKIDGVDVQITVNASPEGKLYGSVGPREIVDALVALGHEVEKGEVIQAAGPVHVVGESEATIVLHADVQATVKVRVVGE